MEAEHAILGAGMFSATDCAEVFERLRPEHFFDPVHARIYAEIQSRAKRGLATDPVSIRDAMVSDAGLAENGALPFLFRLYETASTYGVESHADTVIDRSARRAIIDLAQEVSTRATDVKEPAETVLGALERAAADIARESTTKALAVPAGLTALDNIEAAWRGEFAGAPVGLQTLDHVTGGIREDDVWFIGGRTSMGKSAVALSLARGIATQGRGVLVFSLEMPLREVQARLVSDIAYDAEARYDASYGGNISYGDILKGRGRPDGREHIRRAAKALASLPLTVTDMGGLTIDDIRSQALRQIRAWERAGVKAGAIIIDHIGLVRPVRKTDSKAADTSDIVNELKGMAKQLRAPIIALAQINRATENRNDKRPTLADLNWSGSIEQIADFICLLYREAYYLERSSADGDWDKSHTCKHDIELLIHKNRSGPICNLKAFVDIACNALRDRPESDLRSQRGV